MKVTIFHSKTTTAKTAISPFGDKTFVFETLDFLSNREVFDVMVRNFILNVPLGKQSEPIRTFRRKTSLLEYYDDTVDYFVLDIDQVRSNAHKTQIIEYFKDYRVILGASKSYDGIENFNLKGVLFVEPIAISEAKFAIAKIHADLSDICVVDECVVRMATLNAPIQKNQVFLNNEHGKFFTFKQTLDIGDKNVDLDGLAFSELESIEADTIERLCLKVFQTMGFVAVKASDNGAISFRHHTETKTPGGFFWFPGSPYTMHHFNSTKSVSIFDTVRKLPAAKELLRKDIDYAEVLQGFSTESSVIEVNSQYLTVTSEISGAIGTFLERKKGVFAIRSPMGTGKSTIITHILEEAREQFDMRVLIVTNRISVARDFGKKYGLKVYNEDKYSVGDSLICQFDSLWKYNVNHFDLVVMDEFISLMMHSRNNLNVNPLNIVKFFGAFQKKLVIADAFLTGYENFLLSNKTSNNFLLTNSYRDETTLFNYTDMNFFVNSVVHHADKGRITVSATSLVFIHSLEMLLKKRGKRVVTLTAETPECTKSLIYGLFDLPEHDKWDVLIFSPTLTVGVSNLNDVPRHFHYDSAMSTDVISSLQMIKRTRKASEIHFHVKERINYVKTKYSDLRDEYMGNIGKFAEHNLLFEVDSYGETRLSETGKKALNIDVFKNILAYNHRKAFLWFLRWHFASEPVVVEKVFSGNVLDRYAKMVKKDANSVLRSNIEQFLDLNEIDAGSVDCTDAPSAMRALVEISESIKPDAPRSMKAKILEFSIKDSAFVEKVRFYKLFRGYTHGVLKDYDIQTRISDAIMSSSDSLTVLSAMVECSSKGPLRDVYEIKEINSDKSLKFVLDKCGYRLDTVNKVSEVGRRAYRVPAEIGECAEYVNV